MPQTNSASPSRRGVLQGTAAAAGAAAITAASPATATPNESKYLVGRGVHDTTGPAAENGLMGYSMPHQVSAGIHMRLKARAFVIKDPRTNKHIAWCVADQAVLPVAVHAAIVKKLKARFPGVYDMHNVSVTCTHTHAAPGGCAHDFIYNLAIFGFQKQTFDAFVNGYVEAIAKAHADLRAGSITLGRTQLHDASRNRSKKAFDLNPEADKAHFPGGIDPNMLVLRFKQGSQDIGFINWYSTHGTSLPNTNLYVSGDNKGYAAYSYERNFMGQDPMDDGGFVAAFAQTNAGDMSPNLNLKPGSGPTDNPVENMRIIGQRQADAAKVAFDTATEVISGPIDSRARYVDFNNVQVSGAYTYDGKPAKTSPAVLGASMLAGSREDGEGFPIPEGQTDPVGALIAKLPRDTPTWLQNEQAPKLSVLPVGLIAAAPSQLTVQVLRIGQLVIAAGPGEYTIVSGLRIRQTLAKTMNVPLENVIVQGYSNGYCQYVTTHQEYDSQQYEGGSTLFGRYELAAFQQEFDYLAKAIKAKKAVAFGSLRPPSPLGLLNLVPGVVYDNPPWFKKFGDVVRQPTRQVKRDSTVQAVFVTAHPKNNLRINGTYMEVQRKVNGRWQRVLSDFDFETRYRWKRTNWINGESQAILEWDIPADAPTGEYRFVHHGDSKSPWLGRISAFTGRSNSFWVS